MNKYVSSALLFLILALTISCETDFKTTADYQDITVVYGLIDSKEPIQYVKINKAFLSDSDVLTYAATPDSNQYLYKLEVAIEEWSTAGDKINTFILDTTTIYNKEPGTFYYPEQIIYKTEAPQYPYEIKYIIEGLNDTVGVIYFWMNEESIYKLKIKNPETGKEITAEFELRFNYGEWKWGSQDTTYKYIVLASSSVSAPPSSNTMSYFYWDDQFFVAVDALIPYSDPAEEEAVRERYTSFVDVVVSVAEEDFALYMEVNEPSTSIVQERPNYSNIENGIGIFGSRFKNIKSKKLHSETISDIKSLYPELKFKY